VHFVIDRILPLI